MILFKKITDLHNYLDSQRKNFKTIGFVPTMGALHEGHLSLIKRSKKENSITACSIFINPTQFNDPQDFKKYPVTLEQDVYQLTSIQCDVLFIPPVDEIYPDGLKNNPHFDLGQLETILEGKYRPGHFQGVCMVVQRLLEIVQPDILYIGQKDYQQCKVIAKLIEILHLEKKIKLTICPTQREADGLAMSSRNMRLSHEERKKAICIFQALQYIKNNITPGNMEPLKIQAMKILEETGFRVDYLEIADANSLQPVFSWDGKQKIISLVAASLGNVRLIDNMLIN